MLEYFLSELGCDGTVGSNNEMILVGGYQAKHFLRLTKKYVEEYVKCNTCKGFVGRPVYFEYTVESDDLWQNARSKEPIDPNYMPTVL
jgi:hypothetical protein